MSEFVAPVLQGVGAVGVAVGFTGWFLRQLAVGNFVTKREAEVYIRENETLRTTNDELVKQNGELMEMARFGQATYKALHEAVESR